MINRTKGLKSLIKHGATLLPVVGDLIDNITSEAGGKGRVDWPRLIKLIIRLIIFLVMVYQLLNGSGEVTIDDLNSF